MTIQPIPRPEARGGPALPVTPNKKKKKQPDSRGPGDRGGQATVPLNPQPNQPGWKEYTRARWHDKHPNAGKTTTVTPAKVVGVEPEDPIMTMFHQTLEEIKRNAPQVNDEAIWKPYRDASVVAGGLGQGLASAEQENYGATQSVLTKARAEANEHSAAYGYSTGGQAGQVNPADAQGDQMLAMQSQAQQNAAVGASRAWQDLLNRLGAAKVADAHLASDNEVSKQSMNLAASLPTLRQQADANKLDRDTMVANNKYLYASLDAAGKRAYLSAQTSENNNIRSTNASIANSKRTQQGANARSDKSIAAANKRNAATIKGALTRAQLTSKKTGMQGLEQAIKAITPGEVKESRPIIGYKVTYQADPNGIEAGGKAITKFYPGSDPKTTRRAPPPGYLANWNGEPRYGPAGSGTPTDITLAMWNKGLNIAIARNPTMSREQVVAAWTAIQPKPKPGKKKTK